MEKNRKIELITLLQFKLFTYKRNLQQQKSKKILQFFKSPREIKPLKTKSYFNSRNSIQQQNKPPNCFKKEALSNTLFRVENIISTSSIHLWSRGSGNTPWGFPAKPDPAVRRRLKKIFDAEIVSVD